MIVHYKGTRIRFTMEQGEYVARSPGLVGRGKTAKDAFADWRAAEKFVDSLFEELSDVATVN